MMRTRDYTLSIRALAISVLCIMSQLAIAQHPAEGHWEGLFMDDFKTIVKLEPDGESSYNGSIQMFDGMGEIQNDKLSKISFENGKLSFFIEAKQTDFKGTIDEDFSKLSGNFIFPDDSLHPIELQKVEPGEKSDSGSDWL